MKIILLAATYLEDITGDGVEERIDARVGNLTIPHPVQLGNKMRNPFHHSLRHKLSLSSSNDICYFRKKPTQALDLYGLS